MVMMKATLLSRALYNAVTRQHHTNVIPSYCNHSFIKSEMTVTLRPTYRSLCYTAMSASAVRATTSDNVNSNNKVEEVAASAQTKASTEETKSLHLIPSHDKANADFTEEEMLLQELEEPPRHYVWCPFPRQRGAYQLIKYVNVRESCEPDPLAFAMYSGRTDPEWIWLKILCWICIGSTIGTAIYAFFLPEHVKFFKDEPWSPLRNQA